ncbi:TetR/AcrR family transcriptional regulator [Sandarakinorhabdus rubra]|uniref:TetR/AcrR family transcriptional regulator n=1 Tax=Sandarakinorhabdus rubra TaxID=2672568 RepID=UPI0013D9614E|nr:TetR/AcrR family transcriptional regulator [Sandarakinorhabdus rubra]
MSDQQETDGRRLRAMASRDRIIQAVLALIDEGHGIPGAEVIAERAGVGLRSVFRHFGDLDGLYVAMLDRLGSRYTPLVRSYEAPTWQGQVGESLSRRMEMFEGVLPYRRAAEAYRQHSAMMRHGMEALDRMLRGRLQGIVPAEHQADELWFEQLDLWMSLDSYGRLRDRQKLDPERTYQVIRTAVDALLAAKS